MRKRAQVYCQLGFWSSHPRALQRSRKVLMLLSVLPLLAYIALFVFCCLKFSAFKQAVLHPGLSLKIVAAVACVCLGALFSVSFYYLLSFYVVQKNCTVAYKNRRPFPWWGVFVAAIAWIVPLSISLFRNHVFDGPFLHVIEFLINLLCLAPFFWLCLLLFVRSRKNRRISKMRLSLFQLALAGLALVASVLPLFTDVKGGLAAAFPDSSIIAGLHETVIRAALFCLFFPVGSFLLGLVLSAPKVNEDSEGPADDDVNEDDELDVRTVDEVADVVNLVVHDLSKSKKAEWVKCLEAVPMSNEEHSQGSNPSDSMAQNALKVLLMGAEPTRSQSEFLSCFQDLYTKYITAAEGHDSSDVTSPDVFIKGPFGSGRTSALCAVAVFAVLSRGDRVLVFVKDDASADMVVDRIGRILQEMLLHDTGFVTVKKLMRNDFKTWLNNIDRHSSGRTCDVAAPDILVSTPALFERETFSKNYSVAESLDVASIMVEYSTLLVDDVLEHSPSVMAHLVFLVRKLRLLLECYGKFSQLVVVCRSDKELASCNRVYSFYCKDAKVVSFNPECRERVLRGVVRTAKGGSSDEVSLYIARRCVEEDLRLVVCEPSKSVREALQDNGKVCMVEHLNDLALAAKMQPPDIIVCHRSPTTSPVAMAMFTGRADDGLVVVRIMDFDDADETDVEPEHVLPDRTSKSFCYAHLRSLLPFVVPKTPMKDESWAIFAVDDDNCSGGGNLDGRRVIARWTHDGSAVTDSVVHDFEPQLVLTDIPNRPATREIDYGRYPYLAEELVQSTDDFGQRCIVMCEMGKGDVDRPQRSAKWVPKDGGPCIGESDLGHGGELTCEWGGVRYYCCGVVKSNVSDGCAMKLLGARFTESDHGYPIPVRALKWSVPRNGLKIARKNHDKAARTIQFHISGGNSEYQSVPVQGRLTGVVNGGGAEFRFDEDKGNFAFDANLSCILLSPGSDVTDAQIVASVGGNWEPGAKCGYSAVLTHALTAAFQSRFEGFSFYASLVAFEMRNRDGNIGDALIWIIEPVNTGMVCSRRIFDCLYLQTGTMEGILQDACNLVAKVKAGSVELLRSLSAVANEGDVLANGDVEFAERTLTSLLRSYRVRENARHNSVADNGITVS